MTASVPRQTSGGEADSSTNWPAGTTVPHAPLPQQAIAPEPTGAARDLIFRVLVDGAVLARGIALVFLIPLLAAFSLTKLLGLLGSTPSSTVFLAGIVGLSSVFLGVLEHLRRLHRRSLDHRWVRLIERAESCRPRPDGEATGGGTGNPVPAFLSIVEAGRGWMAPAVLAACILAAAAALAIASGHFLLGSTLGCEIEPSESNALCTCIAAAWSGAVLFAVSSLMVTHTLERASVSQPPSQPAAHQEG